MATPKNIVRFGAIALGLLGLLLLLEMRRPAPPDFVLELAEELPSDTVLFMVASSFQALIEDDEAYPGLRESVQEAYGWTPERFDELERHGVDLDAPVAVSLLEAGRPVFVSSIGFSGDLDDVREGLIELAGLSVDDIVDGDLGDIPALLTGEHAVFVREGRLVAVSALDHWWRGSPAADLVEVATRVAERDWEHSVRQVDGFEELTTFERPVDGLLMINVEAAVRELLDLNPGLFAPPPLLGASVGLGHHGDERYLLHRVLFTAGSEVPGQLLGPGRAMRPLERIPGPILAGVHFSVDPERLMGALDVGPVSGVLGRTLKREVGHFAEDVLGADLDDLVEQELTGEAGLFMLSPAAPGAEADVVAFAGVTDEAEIDTLLERAAEYVSAQTGVAPSERDGSYQLTFDQGRSGALAVRDGYLWLALGPRGTASLTAEGAESFMDGDDRIAEIFDGDRLAASYVDASTALARAGGRLFGWYVDPDLWPVDEVTYGLEEQGDLWVGALVARLGEPREARSDASSGAGARHARSRPIPAGSPLEVDGWNLRVLDWRELEAVPDSARELQPDERVIAVRLEAHCTGAFRRVYELHGSRLGLTGERGRHYSAVDEWSFEPRLERNGSTYQGERLVEGTLHFVVPRDETALMLAVRSTNRPLLADDPVDPCRFVALDDGAAVTPGPVEDSPPPSPAGVPVPLGALAMVDDWHIQVIEAFRGVPARRLVRESGDTWQPEAEDMELVVARVRARRTGSSACPARILASDFDILDDRGTPSFRRTFASPSPRLEAELYPGGETEGWLSAEVPVGSSVQLRYGFTEAVTLDIEPSNLTDPFAGPGYTNARPMPRGRGVDDGSWRVGIVEVLRGPEAHARVLAAYPHAQSPEVGLEPLLVRLHLEHHGSSPLSLTTHYLALVDDAGEAFEPTNWPRIEPALGFTRPEDAPTEGWLLFEVPLGRPLVLRVNRHGERYLGLD